MVNVHLLTHRVLLRRVVLNLFSTLIKQRANLLHILEKKVRFSFRGILSSIVSTHYENNTSAIIFMYYAII